MKSILPRFQGSRKFKKPNYGLKIMKSLQHWRWGWLALLLCGCNVISATPAPAPIELTPPASTPSPSATALLYPWVDASAVMAGLCFEVVQAWAGQPMVLRDADQQSGFYDRVDASGLCRRPVRRYPFDFSEGRVLAGLFSRGVGCTARHEVLGWERDAYANRFVIRLRFITEGDCPYELVRGFWIGIEGVGAAEVVIVMEE